MNRKLTITFGVILLAGTVSYLAYPAKTVSAGKQVPAPVKQPGLVVAAGRVEPLSEEIKIASELDGKLKAVLVEEGQTVRKGQILATLQNGDYAARIELSAARVKELEAALLRVNNGSRTEERREANASVRETEAVLANTKAELARREFLLGRGAIARTEYDLADREYQVALARVDAQKERQAVVHDVSRVEDKLRAAAELESAKAQLAEAEALYQKTIIRSPIDGVPKLLPTGIPHF
jgi:HlyD family secretion protein